MIKFLFLLVLYSCSQVSVRKPPPDDFVSVDTALDHIMASYLKGCVEAYRDLKIPISFEICRDKAKFHKNEVREIMDQPL